ncbi:IS3 family transposase [Pseudomonas frederiksbergensis]|uniref:IS3 family transposase n=1 Tax=Pseudomonas frederiksbergensis TaxID=104087 RepID=UPI00101AD5EE|nr:IS3 family transposase [Pseudomonas frederiksbergensis]
MTYYSPERKAALLKMLLPPLSLTVAEVCRREGVSDVSMYLWRKLANQGSKVPDDLLLSDKWSAEARFAAVLETASLTQLELGEYCRRNGLYPEQLNAWRQACISGQEAVQAQKMADHEQTRKDKKRILELERELRRKDAALAETAALLVLRKKPQRLLGDRRRGQLTSLPERQLLVGWLIEAIVAGARKIRACQEVGLSLRTLQRWTQPPELQADARSTTVRPKPRNALSEIERHAIVALCNSPTYAHLPPSQIVPRLADEARYLASEATFYRVLRAAGQQHHRGRSRRPQRVVMPTTHAAREPNQVWSWDITYLPAPIRSKYYYLYLILDIHSRKAVGWEVYEEESGEKAAALLQRSVISEKCLRKPLVLHSDNGAPMKSLTLLSKMYELGITPSRGRPRVRSLFRTLKYCPQWPLEGFASLDVARGWVRDFMRWYNNEHRHSRIRFVTPSERHLGQDHQILTRRRELYEQARQKTPERWSGQTRNWEPIGTVLLNPDREQQAVRKAA